MKTAQQWLAGWRIGLLVLGIATVVSTLWIVLPPRGAISADNWTSPQDISRTTYGSFSPEMVLDSQGYTHAVWWGDGETSSNWAIWYANNRTGNWSTPKRISPQGDMRNAKIAVTPTDGLHVVYEDRIAEDIKYVYSTDYGATWSTPQNISNSPGKAYEPSLCADGEGNIHAVWIDSRWLGSPLYQTTYAKRTGDTWSAPVRVQSSVRFNKAPRVTTTGIGGDLRVHVTFYGKSSDTDPNYLYEVYYIRGVGASWETLVKLSEGTNQASYDPDIASSGTSVYVVWDETPPSSYHDIYLKYSTDNGSTWSTLRPIVVNSYLSRYPACAFGQNRLQIAYDDNSAGAGDAFYTYFDPSSGLVGPLINLAASSGESKETDIVVNVCRIAVAWMDKGNVWNILYTTTPPTPPGPCPSPTSTPTPVTPQPTNTPVPTATPDPRPQGSVSIIGNDPPYSQSHTHSLTSTLLLHAVSNVGATIVDMLVCNEGECAGALWVPYVEAIANWPLKDTGYDCEYKYVHAQFRDNAGRTSNIYTDVINYDNYLTASMSLNGGQPYTNRIMVAVDSVDLDSQQESCSGLQDMRLKESTGLTFTLWISYYPRMYFFLAPSGPTTRTVEVQYRDRAYNLGIFSDTIAIDLLGPVGEPPTLNNGILSTTHLLIPISGLQATDPSGIRHVWVANHPDGPWMVLDYCASPPCTYTWNLGYGGPPILYPGRHTVYVMYEDGAGYGGYPGNLSQVYTGTIYVYDIHSIFLPVIFDTRSGQGGDAGRAGGAEVILLADPQEAAPGQEVLLYLAAWREESTPLEGTLRLTLPEGLRVIRAQSAYGQILQVGEREVASRERAWSARPAWIIVQARVEEGATLPLRVQGDLTWDRGTVSAAPLWIENR